MAEKLTPNMTGGAKIIKDTYYRERTNPNPIQEDKDKYSNPPL